MAIRPQRSLADYADIIDLPHPDPTTRPRMSHNDRAAQFSPYAALTGYEDVVAETARLTDEELILDETQKDAINEKLRLISNAVRQGQTPAVEITCFVPDSRKAGGSYRMVIGCVKRVDPVGGKLILINRQEIPLERISAIICGLCPD